MNFHEGMSGREIPKVEWGPSLDDNKETGQEAEVRTFGKIKYSDNFRSVFNALARPGKEGGKYFTFRDAMRVVFEATNQDPENLPDGFANDLRIELIDLISEDDFFNDAGDPGYEPKVLIWNSVDTPIDKLHGIDAIVEYQHPGMRKPIRVSLDVTLRPDKAEDGHKADIIFYAPPDPDDKRVAEYYMPYVEKIADEVLRKIRVELEEYKASTTSHIDKGSSDGELPRRRRVVSF